MTFFIIIHLVICVFLVFVILLQPGKSDGGIGFGSSSQSIFGSRGAGNFLTKTTSACALLFLVTSFVLTRSRIQEHSRSVIGKPEAAPVQPKDAAKAVPPSTERLGEAVRSSGQEPAKGEPAKAPEPVKKETTKEDLMKTLKVEPTKSEPPPTKK